MTVHVTCKTCGQSFETHELSLTVCVGCLMPQSLALRMYLVPDDFGQDWIAKANEELGRWETSLTTQSSR